MVHELVTMLIDVDESRDKLLVAEREVWVEKGDDMSKGSGFDTRMRRSAWSKSTVRDGVEGRDESI